MTAAAAAAVGGGGSRGIPSPGIREDEFWCSARFSPFNSVQGLFCSVKPFGKHPHGHTQCFYGDANSSKLVRKATLRGAQGSPAPSFSAYGQCLMLAYENTFGQHCGDTRKLIILEKHCKTLSRTTGPQ